MLQKFKTLHPEDQKDIKKDIIAVLLTPIVLLLFVTTGPEYLERSLFNSGRNNLLFFICALLAADLAYGAFIWRKIKAYRRKGRYMEFPKYTKLALDALRKIDYPKVFWVPLLPMAVIFLYNRTFDAEAAAAIFAKQIGPLTWQEPWRIWLSQIFHYNVLHFGFNFVILWMVGRYLYSWYSNEQLAKMLAITFTVPAVLNVLMGYPLGWIDNSTHSIGASGAIYALLTINLLSDIRFAKVYGVEALGWTVMTFIIVLLSATLFIEGRINHTIHLLGLTTGIVYGLLVPPDTDWALKNLRRGHRLRKGWVQNPQID